MTTSPTPEAEADWRPRVPPEITARVARYAASHPRAGRPLSRNDAAIELLTGALDAAEAPVTIEEPKAFTVAPPPP